MTTPRMLDSRATLSHAQPTPRAGFSHVSRSLFSRSLAALVAVGALASAVHAVEIPYDVHVKVTPETSIFGHFSKTKAPVATVKSGAVVRIDGGGGNKWGAQDDPNVWLKANNVPITTDSHPVLIEIMKAINDSPNRPPPEPGAPAGTGRGGHFLVGPIYIEDAEPGDSLEVRILDVTPRLPYGANAATPTGGGLPGVMPRPFSKVYHLDLKRNVAVYDKNLEIPLAPFNGVNGTCPPDEELTPVRRSGPPGSFGGNLDSKDLITGSTLYLPIYQKGALFYTGDCHAAQGDGEIAGDAIGTANTVTYQFILHKGKTLKGPWAETPKEYIIYGLDPDLDQAMKNAMLNTLDFLKEKKGYDLMQAYTLSSAAVDFHVTQVVDRTLGIHGKIAKKLFINEPDNYWYRTPRF